VKFTEFLLPFLFFSFASQGLFLLLLFFSSFLFYVLSFLFFIRNRERETEAMRVKERIIPFLFLIFFFPPFSLFFLLLFLFPFPSESLSKRRSWGEGRARKWGRQRGEDEGNSEIKGREWKRNWESETRFPFLLPISFLPFFFLLFFSKTERTRERERETGAESETRRRPRSEAELLVEPENPTDPEVSETQKNQSRNPTLHET